MRLLDRYVIRNFVQVYFYCIAGFISIWLIFDVSDNISTFIDEHISLWLVVRYYATQIPQVLIILLPVSLLLSLLFALGRMSRSNEIFSMLTARASLFFQRRRRAPRAIFRARCFAIEPTCGPGLSRTFVSATRHSITYRCCNRTRTTTSS